MQTYRYSVGLTPFGFVLAGNTPHGKIMLGDAETLKASLPAELHPDTFGYQWSSRFKAYRACAILNGETSEVQR